MVVLFLIFWGKLQSDCTSLHSHRQCTRVPVSPVQRLSSFLCLVVAILIDIRWYLIVVSVCIFLMISDVDIFSYTCRPFVCLVGQKLSISSFACLGYFFKLHVFLIFFPHSLSDNMVCKYLLPFCRLPFHFVSCFLAVQRLFSLVWSDLSSFAFVACVFGGVPKKLLLRRLSRSLFFELSSLFLELFSGFMFYV